MPLTEAPVALVVHGAISRWASAVAEAPQSVVLSDPDGLVIAVSAAAAALLPGIAVGRAITDGWVQEAPAYAMGPELDPVPLRTARDAMAVHTMVRMRGVAFTVVAVPVVADDGEIGAVLTWVWPV